MHKDTLYITFDGLSDPLGQSQILPYLCGVAANGFHIHILSCEKEERLQKEKDTILQLIKDLPITWDYILYDEAGGAFTRIGYILKISRLANAIRKKKNISLLHCRSYMASLTGLSFKRKHGIPFVFDMRGFWADERIDGGIWKRSNPIQDFFYKYFKKKEKQFIQHADAIVSLTNAAVKELGIHYSKELVESKTTVIPCCTNTALFSREAIQSVPSLPSVSPGDHLLIYTGSIGTWYFTREMIACVLAWKALIPSVKLLILTKDSAALDEILSSFSAEDRKRVVSASSSHKEVAAYLAMAKAAIFFIKPSYSKIASSPTKMAECWSMDLPIITNAGIGDNDLFFRDGKGGVLLHAFSQEEYMRAGKAYLALSSTPGAYREIALKHFDTKMAVDKYTSVYKSLTR